MRIFTKAACAMPIAILMTTSACSEGGIGSSPTAGSVSATVHKNAVPVHVIYKLGRQSSTSARASRSPKYIAATNATIKITVTPLGGSPTSFGPSLCTIASCTINFTTTPGPNQLDFLLNNGLKLLSRFTIIVMVQPATLNTLKFTANPVVDSVALSLQFPTQNAGTAVDDLLTITAKDKDLNTITGNVNYVDVNGDPVVLRLNVTDTQAGGKGTVNIVGPLLISGPQQTPIYAHYDGNWLESSTISVSSSSSAVTNLTGVTFTTIPHVVEYAKSGNPTGITTGPDGNLWYTENTGNNVDKINATGTTMASYSCVPCNRPQYITTGVDGRLWITGGIDTDVFKMTTQGVLTTVGSVGSTYPEAIVTGPDGNMWVAISGASDIGRMNPSSGAVTLFATSGATRAINVGPDGNLWFQDTASNKIGRSTPGGIITEHAITNSGVPSDGIVTGPDGNIWFTEYVGNLIGKSTPEFGITEYATQAGGHPGRIVVGPDQNLWFTEPGTSSIGRITMAGGITEYGAAFGVTAASGLQDLTLGPDGNIWFTQWNANSVGKFVY